MFQQPRAIVFLGPPGSGKGTQAAHLSAALEIPAISTGEILRREAQMPTEFGRRLQRVLSSGELLPDEQMNEIVANRIARKDCGDGFILDGYPRTTQQAVNLDRALRRHRFGKPLVFELVVSAEELIARLRCRRQCPTCGRIYGALEEGASIPTLCPNDRSLLVAREDDQPSVIRQRLEIYRRNCAELIRHYEGRDLHRVRASLSVKEVAEQIFEALGLRAMAAQSAPAMVRMAAISC